MNADGRQLQLAIERAAIECLDVDQFVRKPIAARVDFPLGQGIKHEGVVGVGAMADPDSLQRSIRGGVLGNHNGIPSDRGRQLLGVALRLPPFQ